MHYARIPVLVLSVILSACASHNADDTRPAVTGSQRDAHGCIPSAGYRWCERTDACERPWELAQEKGFENTTSGFQTFCASPAALYESMSFECERGESIQVTFNRGGTATVHKGEHVVELPQSPAASGYHYTNGKLDIRGKDEELLLTVGRMMPLRCRVTGS